MTTKTLADKAGADLVVDLNLALGRVAAALCRSFNLSTEDKAALDAVSTKLDSLITQGSSTAPVPTISALQAKPIAASASNFALGTGTAGDVLEGVLVQPTGT